MPHASGNPTWVDYPDTSTPYTASRSEAWESAIDRVAVATFGSETRTTKPDVRARLSASVTLGAGANVALTTWTLEKNPDSAMTTDGVFTVPSLATTFRWRIQLHGRFVQATNANRNLALTRNSTTVTNASLLAIATCPIANAQGNGDIFDVVYEGALTPGDAIRFFANSSVASTLSAASVVTSSPPGDSWVSIVMLGAA